LGKVLALLDSLRAGDARVRQAASHLLSKMLRDAPSTGLNLDLPIAEGRVAPAGSGPPEPLELTGDPRALSRALDEIRGDL
jgi:hypothetical protein